MEEDLKVVIRLPYLRTKITHEDLADLGWMLIKKAKISTDLGIEYSKGYIFITPEAHYNLYFNGEASFQVTKSILGPYDNTEIIKDNHLILNKTLYKKDIEELKIENIINL